jgi:cell division septum initiation protein DivIVA
MSVEVAAPLRIGIAGVFTLRADAAIPGSVDARHEFTLDETHATVTEKAGDNKSSTTVSATAAASSSSSAASAPAAPAKPARVTANTMASTPSDIPLSCPTDQPLAQLVRLINLAKEESDRYLTQVLNQQKAAGHTQKQQQQQQREHARICAISVQTSDPKVEERQDTQEGTGDLRARPHDCFLTLLRSRSF